MEMLVYFGLFSIGLLAIGMIARRFGINLNGRPTTDAAGVTGRGQPMLSSASILNTSRRSISDRR